MSVKSGGMIPVLILAALWGALAGWGWGPAGQTASAGSEPQWAWMDGATTTGGGGVYGTLWVPADTNKIGAREKVATWSDASGALWLFGGRDGTTATAQYLNDLWRFTPGDGWVWMGGESLVNRPGVYGAFRTATAGNIPGARWGASTWVDPDGAMWLFGGEGYDSAGNFGLLNDVWKFTLLTGWAWMKGANTVNQNGDSGTIGTAAEANTPGSRRGAASWPDKSGNLWLFGGLVYDTTYKYFYTTNELWKYDRNAGNWTCVKEGQIEHYGTRGVPAAANLPGSRQGAAAWTDPSGVFWMFGGWYDRAGLEDMGTSDEYYNDLWRYDPATGYWTWMKGKSWADYSGTGTYGTLGAPDPANTPGPRWDAVSWTDALGNLWLFGGRIWTFVGYHPPADSGIYHSENDLWKYDRSTGNWTCMKGNPTVDLPGGYGSMGVPDAANTPGARQTAAAWTDLSGDLWLFGGNGFDSGGTEGGLNDLWRLQLPPDTAPPTGSIVINNNQEITNSLNTTLSLTWADAGGPVARMRFSNDGATWSDWESLAATKAWTLLPGEGYKTVRAQFRDKAGNTSVVYSDCILAKNLLPEGTIMINNGDVVTPSPAVTLSLTWTGAAVTSMRFSDNGATWTLWEPVAATRAYILPSGDGYHTVRVQFRNAAGTRSAVASDYIKLVAPLLSGSILINNGDFTTTSQAVTLTLTWPVGPGFTARQMRFSDNGSNWTAWEPVQAVRAYTLPSGAGYHTVRVQYRSTVGGYSAVYSDYIKLIMPPLTVPNVMGRTQAEATTILAAAGLMLGTITFVANDIVAPGLVVSESPAAGVEVEAGSAVSLSVVEGTPPVHDTVLLPGNVPLEIVQIPEGTFTMGSPNTETGHDASESPQHEVSLDGFWMGRCEVTKRQWQAVMGTTPWAGQICVLNDPDSPAVHIDWNDAHAFLTQLNTLTGKTFYLPSEAQWEYACRAGSSTRFYWGNDPSLADIGAYEWWSGNAGGSSGYARAVGGKLPNRFGLHDMLGNVEEWCEDDAHSNYTGAPADGQPWLASPRGANVMVRGGSWNSGISWCRSAWRIWVGPGGSKVAYLGFRVACMP